MFVTEEVLVMSEKYTGRKIAIFTDVHSLLEPLEAALDDIDSRGITEIYSLGDNIGVGPNPGEVIDLLEKYGVKSVAGNSEEYVTLGIEPFSSYFGYDKIRSQNWTISKLNEKQIGTIQLYPHSFELMFGGKKLALCHFANDVRFDFTTNSTWSYQANIEYGDAYRQFLYTNSPLQKKKISKAIESLGVDSPYSRGYISALNDPLFSGNRVSFYDAIIQGHVHFKLYEKGDGTDYYTIRAVGMAYQNDPIDTASYVILKEKTNNQGFDVEEVLVKFDREKMEYAIMSSDGPMDMVKKFTNMRR